MRFSVPTGDFRKPGCSTDLDKLEKGDMFFIQVLDETLAYEVDQIKTVLPEDTGDLQPSEEQDYVTLVTCTPYGVNTHRLLVRGKRVPYDQKVQKTWKDWNQKDTADNRKNNSYCHSCSGSSDFLLLSADKAGCEIQEGKAT